MVNYNISHLDQPDNQNVSGPIQDDEALFLYSIVRGCRLSYILEIGGLDGYSARNFLQAMDYPRNENEKYMMYTCDTNPVVAINDHHKVIIKDAIHLTPEDLDNNQLDMVFYDCHDMVQLNIHNILLSKNIITDNTIIALHDTNLHYDPHQHPDSIFNEIEKGFAHQTIERKIVNIFKKMGYDVFNIQTDASKHSDLFPVRHGISICRKFKGFTEP